MLSRTHLTILIQVDFSLTLTPTYSFNLGITALQRNIDRAWKNHHTLCFDLFTIHVELLFIANKLKQMEQECTSLLLHADTNEEKSDIYILLFSKFQFEVSICSYFLFYLQ
jgi:hypothetical protein